MTTHKRTNTAITDQLTTFVLIHFPFNGLKD